MKASASLVALALSLPIAAPLANAAVLLNYISVDSTSNSTIAATNVVSGITATALAAGAGITANTGSSYNWNNWNETTASDALTAGDLFSWGFEVTSSSATVNLSDLGVRYDRSNTGPTNVEIAYSKNGGAFSTIFTDVSVNASGEENTILLSSITPLQNLIEGDAVTFRLVGWGASSSAGTFDLENTANFGNTALVINGSIPEPTAALLGSLGMLGLLRRRRP